MSGTTYQLEVTPQLPPRLARLTELANNLWYSWDRPTRTLFSRLDPELWHACGHSPKAFLKRVSQHRLDSAATDPVFLASYHRVLSAFDSYHDAISAYLPNLGLEQGDLVAYFCAEFGFHESLPIYSGGLGILAGDHCKAASDLSLPIIGVGLLYRQGYFTQTIDSEGRQHAKYTDSDFDDLPVTPVRRDDGTELDVLIDLPQRTVAAKVWQAHIGKAQLVLLDTDIEQNTAADRGITHRLYGGSRETRLEQEIVLGVGGVHALNEMRLSPTVWHINEGHAAFLVLERMRQLTRLGLDFRAALEAVAANTVFTTHTAVPAGHDQFSTEVIRRHFDNWCSDLGISCDQLLTLGWDSSSGQFNMTALAVRCSRFQNAVSRIHRSVSARICANLWPQIEHEESPLSYVTNGVHSPTFLSDEWRELFERQLGPGWDQRLEDADCQKAIHEIPDHLFWSVHQSLKAQMLHLIRYRITQQHIRNQGSQAHLDRIFRLADPANPNVLTIGFARRFATYKRATLLFENLNWLREIVSDVKRPVLFVFAGKAHPADEPGQELMRRIVEISQLPEFEGHLQMIEGYDLQLARRLVSGVDVWLNNPEFPLEACGTSGMKAGMNGILNLSVLDGWWDEGYDGSNGWAIMPASTAHGEQRRTQEEARTLYEVLQDSVIPLYYETGPAGFSPRWIAIAKHAITSILPRFNATRMLNDYLTKFYRPAGRQWRHYSQANFAAARTVSQWKVKVHAGWGGIRLRRIDHAPRRILFGKKLRLEVAFHLNGLAPEDVVVELLFGRPSEGAHSPPAQSFVFKDAGLIKDTGEQRYVLEFEPQLCGQIEYRVRAYPHHELLTHRFEMGMMVWL